MLIDSFGASPKMLEPLATAHFAVRFTPRRVATLIEAIPWVLIAGGVICVRELTYIPWSTLPEALVVFFVFIWFGAWLVILAMTAGLLWMLLELYISSKKGIQIPQVLVDARGLTIVKLFSREFFNWEDITVFYVMEYPQAESAPDYALIAFGSDQIIPVKPRHQRAAARVKLSFPGVVASQQHTYELLCRWANLWRTWAMEGGTPPSLGYLDSILRDVEIEVLPATEVAATPMNEYDESEAR